MKDQSKTKQMLIHELASLKQRIVELEQSESERKPAEEALREREGRFRGMAGEMAVIAEISRIIGSTLKIDEVYERFAAEAKKLILVDSLAINLYNFQENTVRVAHVSGVNIDRRKQGDPLVLEGSLSEAVIRAQTGLRIQPANIDEIVSQFPRLSTIFQAGLRSIMCVPLVSRDEVIGVLHFRSKTPNAYTEQDLRLAERIGAQIAGAIANAQLFSDLKQAEEALQLVHDELEQRVADRTEELMRVNEALITEITERKHVEEVLNEKDKFMDSMLQNSAVATFVVNAEHEVIYWNRACEDLTGIQSKDLLGTSNHWKAFYDHSRPCVADIIIDNTFNEMTDLYKVYSKSVLIPNGIRAEGWYPNLGGKNRYILFDAAPIRDHNGKITAAIETLQDITERRLAEEQLKCTLESLRRSFGTTIQVMVSAVETRDPYTSGHQIRMANIARAIATEMELTQDQIEGIRMAGSIHDIGKLSIPAEILSKPGKLSEIEFSLIKEHARKGYEMLKDVESPWPLAEIVYQHHERMDGSGYPRKLQGEAIFMEAHILAVADVMEAMSSHRPYRAGLGIEAALNEIEKNRGIFYDNTVADACLRIFREKGFQLEGT
ncbi:MAG: HD domain-containing protein [Proteobacteria bacterium]|nr:HD domain-containing protein [Pseudomonadota bacterium]